MSKPTVGKSKTSKASDKEKPKVVHPLNPNYQTMIAVDEMPVEANPVDPEVKEFKKPQPGKVVKASDQNYITLNNMDLGSLAIDDIPVKKNDPPAKTKKCFCC